MLIISDKTKSMNQFVLALMLLIVSLCSPPVFSAGKQIKWPVITQVKVTSLGQQSYKVEWQWHSVPVTVTDEPLQLPGEAIGTFYMRVNRSKVHGGGVLKLNTVSPSFIAGGEKISWDELSTELASIASGSASMLLDYNPVVDGAEVCVGFGLLQASVHEGGLSDAPLAPRDMNGNCVSAPPPNEWCAMQLQRVDFFFDTLPMNDAAGQSATKNIQVFCTTAILYQLELIQGDRILLNNGMSAELAANGLPLGSPIQGEASLNYIPLTITLSGTPERAGVFNGVGTLSVTYP